MPTCCFDQQAQRLVAHARRGPRAVGNVHRIHADRLQKLRAFDSRLAASMPLGRNDLHHGDELAVGDFAAQLASARPTAAASTGLAYGRGGSL